MEAAVGRGGTEGAIGDVRGDSSTLRLRDPRLPLVFKEMPVIQVERGGAVLTGDEVSVAEVDVPGGLGKLMRPIAE